MSLLLLLYASRAMAIGTTTVVMASLFLLLLVPQCQCISSFVFYIFVTLVVQFPARGSTKVLLCLFLVCCCCNTSYIVSVHIQCQASIYAPSLCRRHSWRVRLAKQETLTPPGHLVSPLVCRGPWMSTVVLYCWCHSDGASVLWYFTFM